MAISSTLSRLDLAEAVVLCGAGISIEPPSSLPAGDELALDVFDLTTGGLSRPYAADAIARARREIHAGELRLEVICDLLSSDIDPTTVVSPFGLLRASAPNRLHLALSLLAPRAVITTNQDLLLEAASAITGRRLRTLHLHGRCDNPRSIVTTVAGYLHGLPTAVERKLGRFIDGRDLVVIGYSGRDLDVMAALVKTAPRRVVWIEHGARHSRSDLPPELLAAERRFGARWTRVATSTGDWLEGLLGPTDRAELRRALAVARTMTPDPRRAASRRTRLTRRFDGIDPFLRQLAIGRILRHAGLQREAQLGYARLLAAHPNDPRATLAWAQATFELNEFEPAIEAFRIVADDGADPRLRGEAVLAEVEALRDMSRFDDARIALDRLPAISAAVADPTAQGRLNAAGQCQRAGIARMDGELRIAKDAYRIALEQSLTAGDIRGVLESRTWHTEIMLALGQYQDALATSRETLDYQPFINARWLTWAMFVHGEALCAADELAEGLDVFREALDDFARYGNPMGEAWTLAAEGSFRRSIDLVGASHALDAAEEAISRYRSPLLYAEARVLWEQAELERARRDLRASARRLQAFRQHVARSFPGGHAWLTAHGNALQAELDRERGLRRAEASATSAQNAYEALEADGAARRMALSVWAAREAAAGSAPPSFAKDWKRRRYALEQHALDCLIEDHYAPLNVWFVP